MRGCGSEELLGVLLLGVLLGPFVPLAWAQVGGNRYRLCVPDVLLGFCQQMVVGVSSQGGRIDCIPGNDKIDCIGRVARGEADVLVLEPEEIYVAHRFFHDAFFVLTEVRTLPRQGGSFRYEPVAVIRNNANIRSLADLRQKRSCHTAFGRTSGWEVPISRLMDKSVMPNSCAPDMTTVERELASASHFFAEACAPGTWVPDKETDKELKEKYSNLCALCENNVECQENDKFAGFRGSLRCLTENGGDVAWTRLETVYQFFSGQSPTPLPQTPIQAPFPIQQAAASSPAVVGAAAQTAAPPITLSDYSFLCPDGTRVPINTQTPCTWAGRPWKAFVASNRHLPPQLVADLQQQITVHRTVGRSLLPTTQTQQFSWPVDILEIGPHEMEFHIPSAVAPTVTPLTYLDRGNYTSTIEKPTCPNPRITRFCVRSDLEKQKCMALRMAAIGRRIAPFFDCVLGESRQDCMLKVASGQADVLSVSPKEAFQGSRQYRLTPILSEAEPFGDEENDAARYTVAVVRADAGIQSILDLRGKRSCHGSVTSLSGWNIPLTVLRDVGLISPECDFGRQLSAFFRGSCVPGAADSDLKLPESLCSLCVGSTLDAPAVLPSARSFCANNELEGFYGDLGAFRCLPTLAADVAFTDHLTPLLNTDGLANATWARGLRSADFRLVCPYGASRAITEFRECHWGRIPADKVITAESKDYVAREDIRISLLKVSQTFHPDQTVLRLFGPYLGVPDLLFKDMALGLVPMSEGAAPHNPRRIDQHGRFVNANKDVVYDQQYANRIIRDIDDCNAAPRQRTLSWLAALAPFLLTFVRMNY